MVDHPPLTPATVSDFQDICQLLQECALHADDLTPDHLRHFIVQRDKESPVGTVGLEVLGEHALLRSLAVAKSARGKGLGIHLVQQIEQHAQDQNVRTLYLLTTTADLFFERLGYNRIERGTVPEAIAGTTEFASLCPDSAVCMYKRLD